MTPQVPIYQASPWGARFHSLTVDEALGGGSAGPGKSVVLIWDPISQVIIENKRATEPDFIPPGFTEPQPIRRGESKGYALHLRRTMPMLGQTRTRMQQWYPHVDPKVRWYESDQFFIFSSGMKIRLGHCTDRDDWMRYQGDEITHLGLDEGTQFLENQYDQLTGRVRTDDPVLMTMKKTRIMSNPNMDMEHMDGVSIDGNPHWLRDMFVAPCREGGKVLVVEVRVSDGSIRKRTRVFMPARLHHNPNEAFRLDYEATLKTKKSHIRKALLDGDWWVTAGSFFSEEWDEDFNVVQPFNIPETWPWFRSLDWGYKVPGICHWWVMDPDENLIGVAEYKFQERTPKQVARGILAYEEALGLIPPERAGKKQTSWLTGPADTQLWEQRDSAVTKAAEMAAEGVHWEQADKKSRRTNAERVSIRLKDRRGGRAGLSFFGPRCPEIVQVLPQIQTDKDDPNCPREGGNDHPYDSAAYAAAYASGGRAGLRSRPAKKSRYDDDDERPVQGSRGSYGYGGH